MRGQRCLHRGEISELSFGGKPGEGQAGRRWEVEGRGREQRAFLTERTARAKVGMLHGILEVTSISLKQGLIIIREVPGARATGIGRIQILHVAGRGRSLGVWTLSC